MKQFNALSPEKPGAIKPEDQNSILARADEVHDARCSLQSVMRVTRQVIISEQPIPASGNLTESQITPITMGRNRPDDQLAKDARATLEEIFGNAA